MAESKRQSVSGNKPAAATATKGPQLAADLSKAIGAKVRINTTLTSHSAEGTIYAVDTGLDLIVLRDANTPAGVQAPAGNFRILPVSQVSSFKVLSAAKEGDDELLVAKVDTDALRQREGRAIADAKKAEANIGKGVTKEAQEIYDHISRTLPVRWSDKTIVVSDSVLVESPYGVDNVKAPSNKSQALAQIQRVVGGYWQKKSRTSGASTPVNNGPPARPPIPAVPLGQRKGG